MKNPVKFDTLEDMIAFALAGSWNPKIRWTLHVYVEREFVDPIAGNEWKEERSALPYVSYDSPDRQAFNELSEELETRKPDMMNVTHYSLSEGTSGYPHDRIDFAHDLGKQVEAIWTHKPAYAGSSWLHPVGTMTVTGILKRLGKTDIGDQVRASQKAAELESAKNSRNYQRREARSLATKLVELMSDHPEITWPTQLSEIANLAEEE